MCMVYLEEILEPILSALLTASVAIRNPSSILLSCSRQTLAAIRQGSGSFGQSRATSYFHRIGRIKYYQF